ncbi:hypothetical protein B0T10DRAFT_106002 [Thelonectria olida]|uniref:Uncharacterized protein n=1 Tax=Thelonectria olida TaxID=1576542 RepID=A0A9P8WG36_9HYPO|nr:hypothetical protein B0T10DRAFT_106002 [Thelonectria olida]
MQSYVPGQRRWRSGRREVPEKVPEDWGTTLPSQQALGGVAGLGCLVSAHFSGSWHPSDVDVHVRKTSRCLLRHSSALHRSAFLSNRPEFSLYHSQFNLINVTGYQKVGVHRTPKAEVGARLTRTRGRHKLPYGKISQRMVEEGWEGRVGHLCDMTCADGGGRNAHQWNSRLSHWANCDLQLCCQSLCHSFDATSISYAPLRMRAISPCQTR